MNYLESEQLQMKALTEQDWPLFQRLHQDDEVIRYAFDQPSVEEIRQRFESRLPTWNWPDKHWLCLVIREKQSGQAVGVTGLCIAEQDKQQVEVGYLLLPEHHGKGYGTESLIALIEHATHNLPISAVNAIVTDGNIASCKVLEKAGFTLREREKDAYQIGGRYYDDLIYRYQV
ncbi:GNAT family N-acetyltransferase [Vibrio sp. JPW-9-11-11]|uniref:GNAT family N-acetyltransferase n=1 Tax=Vibrio sp. JPW-9-11-11 TaxID=1416532 RepID=UPI001594CFF4|nr:GNAT family N-acetyltransferase [Vibrio sp. JPW-9-11-11]NVD07868.1 GNAT family N-acetyltransferase [Vibrio sp. JPW-9-11-11]